MKPLTLRQCHAAALQSRGSNIRSLHDDHDHITWLHTDYRMIQPSVSQPVSQSVPSLRAPCDPWPLASLWFAARLQWVKVSAPPHAGDSPLCPTAHMHIWPAHKGTAFRKVSSEPTEPRPLLDLSPWIHSSALGDECRARVSSSGIEILPPRSLLRFFILPAGINLNSR